MFCDYFYKCFQRVCKNDDKTWCCIIFKNCSLYSIKKKFKQRFKNFCSFSIEGKINKLCSSKCRLDSYFQLCRINFNSCTVISSRFFVCWKVVQLYNFSGHEKPTGNDCAGIKVNFAHEKLTGNNCAGIKVNSAQLEITVQSAFGAAQFIDFTPDGQ